MWICGLLKAKVLQCLKKLQNRDSAIKGILKLTEKNTTVLLSSPISKSATCITQLKNMSQKSKKNGITKHCNRIF